MFFKVLYKGVFHHIACLVYLKLLILLSCIILCEYVVYDPNKCKNCLNSFPKVLWAQCSVFIYSFSYSFIQPTYWELTFFNFLIYLKNFFHLHFTFNITLYWFQMYSIVVRQSYTLQSAPPYSQYPPGTIHRYCSIIDYTSCTLHPHIPMTIL